MYELSTGKKAFDGDIFNDDLAIKICLGIPECYAKLAKRCMDQDQNKRPTATVIGGIICYWFYEMSKIIIMKSRNFFWTDKIKLNVESPKHPDHIYTSKLINTQEITSKLDLHEIPNDL